jgi:uncharacterized membrane protein
MTKSKKIRNVAFIGLGIALYIVMSLTLKIPLISHISVDLGYIVLAVYCYNFGAISGALVGAVGCSLMSTLVYGMFPIGWLIGNLVIGAVCGLLYARNGKFKYIRNIIITIVMVFIGVGLIKTIIECKLYHIPFGIKFVKNLVAFACDSIVMVIGTFIAPKVPIKKA